MVSQGDLALKRQLQKSFKVIQQVVDSSEEQIAVSSKLLISVYNLCEQFECCSSVKFETTPLRTFPDMKNKLLLKLSSEIEESTGKLSDFLDQQKTFCQRVSRQMQCVTDLYKKYSEQLDLDTLVLRSATEPSIADMVEWLSDIDACLHQQLCCKQYLLHGLRYGNLETAEKLQKAFIQEEKAVQNQLQDRLDRVMFFMKEDV